MKSAHYSLPCARPTDPARQAATLALCTGPCAGETRYGAHHVARGRARSSPRAHSRCADTCVLVHCVLQLFYSFFKTLVGKEVVVELKNGETYNGELVACDNWMNIRCGATNHADADRSAPRPAARCSA